MKLKGGKMKLLIFIKKIYWFSEKKRQKMVGGLFFLLFSAPSSLLSYLASGLRQQSICRIRFREWQIPNNQVITIIPVGDAPCAFAWNSIQNRVYVANYWFFQYLGHSGCNGN